MWKYLVRRILLFVPTLLGVSIAVFVLLRVIPGDVAAIILEDNYSLDSAERINEQLGLDKPIYVQYFIWISNLVRLDLGNSIGNNRSISEMLRRQFPVTLQLAGLTIGVVFLTAIPVGILAAVRQDSLPDYTLRSISILGLATPSFFAGIIVILVLSIYFRWIPPIGFVHLWDEPWKSFQQLVFPALALGFTSQGLLMRITRGQLLEVMRQDYVRTAYAKGLAERVVILRHAVRNSLLPVVTLAGSQIGALLSGTVAIELIFNLPGVGRALISAVRIRDLPVIEVYVMYFAVVVLVVNLFIDLTYGLLDPRVKYD